MSREPFAEQNPPANAPLNGLDRLAWLYATGCGVGLAPKAPGTFGSLLGPLLVWGWQSLARPIHESVLVTLIGILLGLGILDVWKGWLFWAILTAFLGIGHPPVADAHVPLGRRQVVIAWLSLIIFLVTFIPAPISFMGQ